MLVHKNAQLCRMLLQSCLPRKKKGSFHRIFSGRQLLISFSDRIFLKEKSDQLEGENWNITGNGVLKSEEEEPPL